jgi:hypothetical protein
MDARAPLAWAGRKLALLLSVIFFGAAAFGVVASVVYALFQSSPIWTPAVVESPTESEEGLTLEGDE